jgi:hypothetical protein
MKKTYACLRQAGASPARVSLAVKWSKGAVKAKARELGMPFLTGGLTAASEQPKKMQLAQRLAYLRNRSKRAAASGLKQNRCRPESCRGYPGFSIPH